MKDGELQELDTCVLCGEVSAEIICDKCHDQTRKFSEDESEGSGSSIRAVTDKEVAMHPQGSHGCYDHEEDK